MRRSIEELCELLVEQKEIIKELLTLSFEKRRVVISGAVESLDALVRQEVRKISKLKSIEKKRMTLIPVISELLGIPQTEVTVSEIIKMADSDEGLHLTEQQRELMSLLERLSRFNAENQSLIETHLEYSGAIMEFLSDSEDPLNNYYGDDGKATDSKKAKGFFDGQA